MTQELDLFKERIKRLRSIHLEALGSFNAMEQLLEHRAPNIHGHELAKLHAAAIGDYKGFFNIAEQALNTDVHISVAKLFDSHRDALHIEKLVRYAEANQRTITSAQQANLDPDPDAASAIATVYPGLSHDDLIDIKENLEAADDKINRLKEIRDKKVAHLNLAKPDNLNYLTYEEMSDLIQLSEKILNVVSQRLSRDIALFDPYKEQVIDDTKALLRLVDKAAGITDTSSSDSSLPTAKT